MADNRIKELRKRAGMTLEELGDILGTSKQTVHRYETGVIKNIPRERIVALADALGVTPAALLGWDGAEKTKRARGERGAASNSLGKIPSHCISGEGMLPMLGEISCGVPIFADEAKGDYIPAPVGVSADFCLIADGDSMIGARIYDGDIIFIREMSEVANGEIAAVIIDDEATLKRVYYFPEDEKLILAPENPRYAPLVYVGKELESIKILGKAVAFQSIID
jgi:repressor LexA